MYFFSLVNFQITYNFSIILYIIYDYVTCRSFTSLPSFYFPCPAVIGISLWRTPQCTCTVASWLINLTDVSLYSGCFIVFQVNNLKKLVKGVHDYYTEVCMLDGLILWIMCIRGMHGQKLIDKLSLHLQLTPSINP